jgi:2-keto-4-pentenoate hydratase
MSKFEQLASDLAAAWRCGSTIPLPQSGQGATTRAEAYAVQDRVSKLIATPVVGWKVGATAHAVQLFDGHDGPIPGRIFADRCFDSPAQIPSDLLTNVKVECEFAFRLTRALPHEGAPLSANALAEILTLHTAFELAASRYAPGTGERGATTVDGIADNGSGGAAVLGPAVVAWRDLPFNTMEIEARIDNSPPIQIFTGAYRRDPLEIAVETVADLHARGIDLPAGTCLLTGSLSLPTPVRKGQTVTAKFASLPAISFTMA